MATESLSRTHIGSQRKRAKKTSDIKLSVLKYPTLHILSRRGIGLGFHLLQDESSLMMTE